MDYDVQVVRFIKTTSEMPVSTNTTADYISLGHFDMMHITKLGDFTTRPLQEIQLDRDGIGESAFGCAENHVYSLYVLKGVTAANKASLTDFWCKKNTYTVVSRIHCSYPSAWSQEKIPFSNLIESYCAAQTQSSARVTYHSSDSGADSCVFSFDSAVNYKGETKARVECVFYDSLELGDTVSFMKSNSLAAILEVIRCLSGYQCVKDTYTYCGIDRNLLQANDTPCAECVEKDSELAYTATRFSVREIKNANAFFRKVEKQLKEFSPQFYVTGTADRSIHWKCSNESQFIEVMRALTQNGKYMHCCFNDVITRVGIQQDIHNQSGTEIRKGETKNISIKMPSYQATMIWLRAECKESKTSTWKYSLLKMLGTLEAMYSNYVMDDLAELLIPSVNAFLIRLNHLRNVYGGYIPDIYDEEIVLFLDYWKNMTNDISQLESQLTQHPELMPVRYYIPAMVLQFELRFVEHCCKALSTEKNRNFVPMLLPTESSDLSTLCPLDPREEEYTDACPLLVFVPYKDLYRPWETAFAVAHEVAHYCDDSSRKRIDRHNALIKCVATFIAKRWYNEYIIPFERDSNENLYNKTMDYANDLAAIFTERSNIRYPNNKWYLAQSILVLNREALQAIADPSYLERYLFKVYPNYFFNNIKQYRRIRREEQQIEKSLILQDSIHDYIRILAFLCAECYADIAMILLTDCDFGDYFSSVYLDQYELFYSLEKDTNQLLSEVSVLRQVVRMALVIEVISKRKNKETSWSIENISKEYSQRFPLVECSLAIINQEISDGVHILPEKDTETPFLASIDDYHNIEKYLSECAMLLEKELNDGNSERFSAVEVVREGIKCVHHKDFNWSKIQQYITERA